MSAREAAGEREGGGLRWRLWALAPILLLVATVTLFAASGSSLTGLIRDNPPPLDEFDVRRVTFEPGTIRIRVTNPQPDDLTIAMSTSSGTSAHRRHAPDARAATVVIRSRRRSPSSRAPRTPTDARGT